jgi:hypothetical protein
VYNQDNTSETMRSKYLLLVPLLILTACAKKNPNWTDVRAACITSVSEKLKAPSTARYDSDDKPQETPIGWRWSGYVDAQNSFGANVRSRFNCEVTGKTWEDARIRVNLE